MAVPPKDGKLLYHLTAVENLKGIFSKGLIPRSNILDFTDIADEQIIERRTEKNLNGFVPFHFFAGSPFAGAVQRRHFDKPFVFITIKRTFAEANDFKILTRHPLSLENCNPLPYEAGIDAINWDTMNRREYQDHECCEVCMAECLSPAIIKPANFFCIYTKNEIIKNQVTDLRDTFLDSKSLYININKDLFIP